MSSAPMMTAITVANGAGPPGALHTVSIPRPAPRNRQILIRVHAAGVNRPDLIQRLGFYPPPPGAPSTLGLEVAGEVVHAAGRWKGGEKVCALLPGGGYAQFAACDARHALPVPSGMDYVQAASLPETVFTVWANLFESGGLKKNETALIHGANSGIGVTAIQMAKAAGARVIATARGEDKARKALELGADFAVDAEATDFVAAVKDVGGVDVVLDMVGGPYFAKNLECLHNNGRLVYIAAQAGNVVELPIQKMMQKRLTISGSTLRPRTVDEKARLAHEIERVVWPWIERGLVKPVVDRIFPLAEAAGAHAFLEDQPHQGKVVLEVV